MGRHAVLLVVASLLLVAGLTLGVSVGTSAVAPGQVWAVILRGPSAPGVVPGTLDLVIWRVRLPRPVLAAIVGAGLGVVGLVVQALVRNPLAEPYLLGVSSGASLGAVWLLVFGGSVGALTVLGTDVVVPAGAFVGALLALLLVWAVSTVSARGRDAFSPLRLILTGVTVGQMLGAVTGFLVLQADDQEQTRGILHWLMGSLGGAAWPQVPVVAGVVVLGAGWCLLRARPLNALVAGDETASALGVNPRALRRELFVVASVLTGAIVAVSGAIGFVGLLVPHVCRLVVGADHRRLVGATALVGAALLVWVDLGCRSAAHLVHQELPVTIVTALLGGPVLLGLLARDRSVA